MPPGTAPAFVAPGTAAAIPSGAPGPGLLKGRRLRSTSRKRTFAVPFACQGHGTVSVTAKAVASGTLAASAIAACPDERPPG